MRKGLKRKTHQNLPSLICVEFCPYKGSNHRHHDLKQRVWSRSTQFGHIAELYKFELVMQKPANSHMKIHLLNVFCITSSNLYNSAIWPN
jgi:hypothetical protein